MIPGNVQKQPGTIMEFCHCGKVGTHKMALKPMERVNPSPQPKIPVAPQNAGCQPKTFLTFFLMVKPF